MARRTKIGIVYDITTGQIRRIIDPDEDWQLAAHANVGIDEVFHVESHIGSIGTYEEIDAIVRRVRVVKP